MGPFQQPDNIVLVGMPGAGKSTVGVILAKQTARAFLDTDLLIQTTEHRSLQAIVDAEGPLGLRRIEERVLLGLSCRDHVVATGGSAVYSRPAMAHLRAGGVIVFLDVDLPTLADRIRDFDTRGLAKRPDQSLADLFAERQALYREAADVVIECRGLSQEQVCAVIRGRLGL
jgi:shikimate kinase